MASKKNGGGWWIWLVIILLVAGGAGAGLWYFEHNKAAGPVYQTTAVGRADLTEVITATGTLNPVVNVTVGSQVSGIINKINVDYNSMVKSNEIIAQIDPATYQAAVEQAEADLANAKANLELQQVETRRSAQLFTNSLVSGSDYDTAVATLHEAEATVKLKQAVLDNAQVNLNYCNIRSPVDGVVILRAVDVGQTVASSFNTPTLFEIANDLTKMQIDSSVAEADIGGVREKQAVDFTVDAYPTRTFEGTVVQVRNAPTNANNVVTYDCVIGVTNNDYKLKPGMTADISIVIAQRDNVLNIPNGALRFHPADPSLAETNPPAGNSPTNTVVTNATTTRAGVASGGTAKGHHGHPRREHAVIHTIYVLTGNGPDQKLRAVQITTGISDGINTEVISGLKEGDQVVTSASYGDSSSNSGNGAGRFPRMH